MVENYAVDLYKIAYKLVNPNDCPIVIPSYNRPKFSFLNSLIEYEDDFSYPVYVLVRISQEEDYLKSVKDYSNIHIISTDDESIHNVGLARKYITDYFHEKGYKNIFMIDDDINFVSCLHKELNSAGNETSKMDYNTNVYKTLAVLQLAHEKICNKFDRYIVSGITPKFWCYHPSFSDSKDSLELLHRSLVNLILINLDNFYEYGFKYNSNETHGHEDSDLMLQIIESGCLMGCIGGITYSAEKMNSLMGFNSSDERFKVFWQRCIDQHPGVLENKIITFKKNDTEHLHAIVHWRTGRKLYCPDYYANNKFDVDQIIKES